MAQVMSTSAHIKGSASGQEEVGAPGSTRSLPSSASVEGPHLQACCLPTPAGLSDPLRDDISITPLLLVSFIS